MYRAGGDRPVSDPYGARDLGRPDDFRLSSDYDYYNGDQSVFYDLDHLATYTMSVPRGLGNPHDALVRLRHMARTSGVWTRRLQLRVGSRDLVVFDENAGPIERFPLKLVNQIMSASEPRDGFDNIVGFSVTGDTLLRRPAEIHLFQCLGKPAQDLVNDIKNAKAGKPLTRSSQPFSNASPVSSSRDDYPTPRSDASTNISNVTPRQPELTADDKRNLDLKVLDMCLDDIEMFVTRIQKAATAAKNPNLNADVKPSAPEAKDFYDIFQKFKLSFLVLSRLRHSIRDPNASELLSMLFEPLQLVVDASRSVDGRPQLAIEVVSPLLSTGAIELLTNVLPSKHVDLWRSLGEAWTTPRNNWMKPVPPFVAKFGRDRKSPPKPWMQDVLSSDGDSGYGRIDNSTPLPSTSSTITANGHGSDVPDNTPNRNQENPAEIREREYLRDLQARGAKISRVIKRRDANNPKELTVEVNDIVEVKDDTKNWWSVCNSRGQTGFVPNNILLHQP